MRLSNYLLGAILAIPLVAASDPHATAKVVQGKNACYEIRLPKCWHDSDGRYCISYQSQDLRPGLHLPGTEPVDSEQYFYELRASENQPGTILLGSHHEELTDPHSVTKTIRESPEHYAIMLGKTAPVRPTTDSEWNNAHPLPSFASSPDATYNDEPYNESQRRPYIYGGRSFAKSGLLWARQYQSLPSSDSRYLALNSWDGKGRGATDWWPTPSFDNTGRYWIDLYEVATGTRVIAITGRTRYVEGDHFLEGEQWSGKRYFIFPLSKTLNPFLLCDVYAAKTHK